MIKSLPTMWNTGLYSWVGKVPWRRKWQPTSVFLPGRSHGQRNLVARVHGGLKESDTTERLSLHFTSHSFIILVHRKTSSLHLSSLREHGDVPPRSLLNCLRNQYIFHLMFHFSQLHRATFTNESPL